MKIFFAYSSHGSHEAQDMCIQIGQVLGRFGKLYSDRLGDIDTPALGNKNRHIEIFQSQCDQLRDADLVVAEVSEPSTGVGYEVALALQWGKKVLCLARPDAQNRVSSMIAGNQALMLRPYQSMMDVDRIMRHL